MDISEMLRSIMGYYQQINFTCKFTKKFLFGKNLAIWGQLGPRLCNLIFLESFIMIVRNKQAKAIQDNLHKNFALGKMSKKFWKILLSHFNIVYLKKVNNYF